MQGPETSPHELLSMLTRALRRSTPVDAVMAMVVRALSKGPAQAAAIRLLGDGRVETAAVSDPNGWLPIEPLPADTDRLAIRLAEMPSADPIELALGGLHARLPLGIPEGRHTVVAPLVARGHALGALLAARSDEALFDEASLWLLSEVASRLAQAIQGERLQSELHGLHTLLDNLPSGVILADRVGRFLVVNDQTYEIFRKTPGPVEDISEWRDWVGYDSDGVLLQPSDWPLGRALHTGEVVRGEEIRIARDDGTHGTIRIHAAPVRSPTGAITGAAVVFDDATEHALAKAALRDSEEQLRKIADTLPVLVCLLDRDRRYRFVNRACEQWWGLSAEELIGRRPDEMLDPVEAERVRPHVDAAFAGQRVECEAELARRGGAGRILHLSYVPCSGADGRVDGVVCLGRDVTDARRAEDRLAFLADASRVLSSSLDIEDTLRRLGQLAVPRLADWFAVDLVPGDELDPDGTVRHHTLHHADPEMVALGLELRERWPGSTGFEGVMHSGVPLLDVDLDPERVRAHAVDEAHRAMMSRFGIRSVLRVPIETSRGRLGVLSLATAESGRRFAQEDLALAAEVAARVGLAIDNARLLREAREEDRAKEEFISMLAHELRNPLAPILTGLQLVRTVGASSEATERTLATIERQAAKLARLVDDLLDVSRISKGKIELCPEWCTLDAIVGRAVETVADLVRARRHSLAVDVHPALALRADPVRLEQVLANLLHNAAKYTDPGGHLALAARIEGSGPGARAVLEVSDDGLGIAPDTLSRVFQPFRQGELGLDRAAGGLGLGLTLVQRLVALHGGEVAAHSDGPGLGSRFVVSLPVGTPDPALPSPPPPQRSGSLRILVVDDNIDAATATGEVLAVHGHDIELAHDGPTALQTAGTSARGRFDVVLLDLGLPGMDGFEVARRLRASDRQVRIVALTGYGRESDRQRARSAGIDVHLVKPVDTSALLDCLGGREGS